MGLLLLHLQLLQSHLQLVHLVSSRLQLITGIFCILSINTNVNQHQCSQQQYSRPGYFVPTILKFIMNICRIKSIDTKQSTVIPTPDSCLYLPPAHQEHLLHPVHQQQAVKSNSTVTFRSLSRLSGLIDSSSAKTSYNPLKDRQYQEYFPVFISNTDLFSLGFTSLSSLVELYSH